MKVFTTGVIAALCSISTSCLPVYGQNWQDEEHVWDEDKQEWVVKNKAHGRVEAQPQKKTRERPYDHVPWGKYLSWNVRFGKREPTQREIERAKHKLWVKEVMTARAMQEAEQRKQLLAYRRATGWYAARRNAGLQQGRQAYNLHMSNVYRYYYRY